MIRKGSLLDHLGRIVVTLVVGVVLSLAAIGALTMYEDFHAKTAAAALAAPETSSNCEVWATVMGEDRYRCDDTDYGNVCYDRPSGMLYCLKDEN